jgi:hypothetical protein
MPTITAATLTRTGPRALTYSVTINWAPAELAVPYLMDMEVWESDRGEFLRGADDHLDSATRGVPMPAGTHPNPQVVRGIWSTANFHNWLEWGAEEVYIRIHLRPAGDTATATTTIVQGDFG